MFGWSKVGIVLGIVLGIGGGKWVRNEMLD